MSEDSAWPSELGSYCQSHHGWYLSEEGGSIRTLEMSQFKSMQMYNRRDGSQAHPSHSGEDATIRESSDSSVLYMETVRETARKNTTKRHDEACISSLHSS